MKKFTLSRICIFFIALLVVCTAGALALSSTSVAFGAGEKVSNVNTEGTWLDNPGVLAGERGSGLAIGKNTVATFPSASDGQSYRPSGAAYNALHLYVTGAQAGSLEFRSEYMVMQGGSLNARFRMESDENSANNGLYKAIGDRNFSVTAKVSFTMVNESTSQSGNVSAYLGWSPTGSSDVLSDNQSRSIPASADSVTTQLILNNLSSDGLRAAAGLNFRLNVPSNLKIRVANISVTLDVRMNVPDLAQTQVSYSISGQNRTTVEGVIDTGLIPELYVKPGDIITLYTNVTYTNGHETAPFPFPSYYKKIFPGIVNGNSSVSNVVWEETSSGLQRLTNNEYFDVTGSDIIIGSEVKGYSATDGRKAVFRVGDAPSKVTLRSYIIDRIEDGREYFIDNSQTEIIFNVDKEAPSAPVLKQNSDLFATMQSGDYYTSSYSVRLELTQNYGTVSGGAHEYVYAYVLRDGIANVGFLSEVNLAPGNHGKTDFTYTLANGGTENGERQEIITYENPTDAIPRTNPCVFKKGTWALLLVAVDEAGNCSSSTLYSSGSPQNPYSINMDADNYRIEAIFRHGDENFITDNSRRGLASTYVLAGSDYHDKDGNFLPRYANDETSNFGTRRYYVQAKKMDYVTIRLMMDTNQLQNWELVSYTNYSAVHGTLGETVEFHIPADKTRARYIDITFRVDTDVTDNQRGSVYFAFRKVLRLEAIKTSFVFSGSPVKLDEEMRAYLGNQLIESSGNEKISYDIQYFPLVRMNVAAEANPIVGEELVLNGVTYVVTAMQANGDVYEVTAYRPDQGRERGFVDAGTYWYNASLSRQGQQLYFGALSGELEITKASPNVTDLQQEVPLVYGQTENGKTGLDLLRFSSRDMNGRLIGSTDSVSFLDTLYANTYYGVLGQYEVVLPASDTLEYLNPDVTRGNGREISVRFIPFSVTQRADGGVLSDDYIRDNWDSFSRYYTLTDDGTYVLTEGGLHAGNYESQTITVVLTVRAALAEIASHPGEPIFDGTPKAPEIYTVPADLPYIVYYKEKGASDDTYTTRQPVNAGEYVVRYTVDADNCNYYSEEKTEDFIIGKRELTLEAEGGSTMPAEMYDGITYNTQWLYTYGRFQRLAMSAYADDGTAVTVLYRYSFKQVRDYLGNAVTSDYSDFIDVADLRGDSVAAGKYLMKIQVNHVNNEGEITLLLNVSQAMADDGSGNLLIDYPDLLPTYNIVELSGNTRTRQGHMEFGQYLPEAQENILASGDRYHARYQVLGYPERRTVPGRFYFEDTATILSNNGLEPQYFDENGRLVLPVRYDADGLILPYIANVLWEAGETVDGVFVPDQNYMVAMRQVALYVVRATASFADMKLSDLIFGQRLEEAVFEGAPVVSGGMVLTAGVDYELKYTLQGSTGLARGTHQIPCTFTPSEEMRKNYLEMNPNISLTVNARAAEVTFTGGTVRKYGAEYTIPTIVTSPAANLSTQFTYTDALGREVEMTYDTPVGEYTVTATVVNPNYEGSATAVYRVEKGDLVVTLPPTNPTVRYGTTLGEISLSAGRCANETYSIQIDGTFRFVYGEGAEESTVPEVGDSVYRVAFSPNDESYNDSFETFYYDYTLHVEKAVAEIVVTKLNAVYNTAYLEPEAKAYAADGTELSLEADYGTADGAKPRNAGTYYITYRVAENPHYTGEKEVAFYVEKAEAKLDLSTQTKPYTGSGVAADTLSDIENLGYKVQYRNYQNAPSGVPVEVGRYIATVTVDHINYRGTGELTLNICPATIEMQHLNDMSYGTIEPVTAVFHPEFINYTVLYRPRGTGASFSEAMVTDAGEYDVKLVIDHNGYYAEMTELNGEPLVLLIAKDPATITVQSRYERAYTSYGQTVTASVNPAGVRLNYLFRPYGSTEEFTATQPVEAGEYEVRLQINDPNYMGAAHTLLVIKKADLQVISVPNTMGENPFGLKAEDVRFSLVNPGEVRFNATNENMTAKGKWVVDEDISSYFVGTHHVRLLFVPNDTKNFNVAETSVNITITQRDIGRYVRFEKADLLQTYTQGEISVRAYLSEEFRPPEGYRPIDIIVTYNGSETKPSLPGTYTLSALINDANYRAGINEVQTETLEIIRANLVLSAPRISELHVGDRLGDAVLSGGAAAIEGQPTATVAGEFVILYEDRVMDRANWHYVIVRFIPSRTDLYNLATMEMSVNVLGKDIVMEGVAATSLTYGDPLSLSKLTCVSVKDATTGEAVKGDLVWEDPNAIIDVNGRAAYQFRPFDMDVYNIYYGYIETTPDPVGDGKLIIVPGEMLLDESSLDVHAHVGETMAGAIAEALLYNAKYPNMAVDGVTFTYFDAAGMDPNEVITESAGGYPAYIRMGLRISHPNYYNLEIAPVDVRVFQHIPEENFHTEISFKYYDGLPVTPESLGLHVSETDYQPQDYTLTFYKNGVEVPEIVERGEYSIYIRLHDQRYDGYATIPFTVARRNISDLLMPAGGSSEETLTANGYGVTDLPKSDFIRVYGDTEGAVYAVADGVDNQPEIELRYYSGNGLIYYGAIMPQDAGVYRVTARVSDSDLFYEGEKEFTLTVLKRLATVQMDSAYQFLFGEPISINPVISNQIDASQYTFSYRKTGSEEENPMLPANVGRYTVYVNINHRNFYGKAGTVLIITEAVLTLEESPVFGSIKYGQEFSNVQITGGRVVYGSLGDEMRGRFEIENGSATPSLVGNVPVSVCFYPENGNYQVLRFTAEVLVRKADASIEITVSTNVYNGQMQTPGVVTQPIAGLPVRFEYFLGNLSVEPRDAGTYRVRATVNSEYYEGTTEFDYTIDKATALETVAPVASSVAYGQSIGGSVLSGGSVIYVAGGAPVVGTFVFAEPGLVLGDVGTYTVRYRFLPGNDRDYHEYEGEVEISVVKATSAIVASGIEFVYGQTITRPVFDTPAQQGLYVRLTEDSERRFREIEGSVINSGTYQFTAEIEDGNYRGELIFNVTVKRKVVGVYFVDGNSRVERYSSVYGDLLYARARIVANDLAGGDVMNAAEIEKWLTYTYGNKEGTAEYYSNLPPSAVGEYYVYADLDAPNYTVNREASTVNYSVGRATVEYLEFDSNSLSNQIYGSLHIPSVTVQPAGVQYVVSFPGYEAMPTMAGEYAIRVMINDPNYVATERTSMFVISPKTVTIEDIRVSDKAYDGYAAIGITGELKGIMVGDEVKLTMTARTAGNSTDPGVYAVEILTYEITGLHAANYRVRDPLFNGTVKIYKRQVIDPDSGSFITSPNGFSQNLTVHFGVVETVSNHTNLFTRIMGTKSEVHSFTIKENGIATVLGEKVKVYVKIPEAYRNSENLKVEGAGKLANQLVTFTREGDYISFYTDTSGEIVFSDSTFPYWLIIAGGAVLMLVLGGLLVFFFVPARRRQRVTKKMRRFMRAEKKKR